MCFVLFFFGAVINSYVNISLLQLCCFVNRHLCLSLPLTWVAGTRAGSAPLMIQGFSTALHFIYLKSCGDNYGFFLTAVFIDGSDLALYCCEKSCAGFPTVASKCKAQRYEAENLRLVEVG